MTQDERTKNLTVTKQLGGGSFIGIPINLSTGENYGTLCGLDSKSYLFEHRHVELFQTFASMLTYVLELETAYKKINSLSFPVIPIAAGVASISIIGQLDEDRAERVMEKILRESHRLSLDYFVLDFSGVTEIDDTAAHHLDKIIQALKLSGVQTVLTGIRPDIAIHAINSQISYDHVVIKPTLEAALKHIKLV